MRTTEAGALRALADVLRSAPRRYGAYVVHISIVIMSLGITGSMAYSQERLVALQPGQSAQLSEYSIRYDSFAIETLNAHPVTYQSKVRHAATLALRKGQRDETKLIAERNDHWALSSPWVSEVAIHSTLWEDVYIVLAGIEPSGLASFQLVLNPLVNWIWLGGLLLLAGGLLTMSPSRQAAGARGVPSSGESPSR
jgi:cytochrome c-type biogenesis protein CcmF